VRTNKGREKGREGKGRKERREGKRNEHYTM
jgi:hypothetical protein